MRSNPAPVSMEGAGRGGVSSLIVPVELHEHQVPDFDELVRLAGRFKFGIADSVAPALPQVIVQFRAGAAGARVAHLPEIVLVPEAANPGRGERREFGPQLEGLVVGVVYGGPDAFGVHSQIIGNEFPSECDCLALEVVAEREIPQHLKEGVVACGAAHFLQIVVFSADPQAFL